MQHVHRSLFATLVALMLASGCGGCTDPVPTNSLNSTDEDTGTSGSDAGMNAGNADAGDNSGTEDMNMGGRDLGACGNDVKEIAELCDGSDLNGETCESQGFVSGDLACASDCVSFDTSACSRCGDGLLDPEEECDTDDLDGATCETEGFLMGDISCSDTCTLDTSQCQNQMCGNDVVEGTEVCDGTDLAAETCATQGFSDGEISCNATCDGFDTSLCTTCGDGVMEGNEACDDGNTVDDFTCSADCSVVCRRGYGECNNGVSTYCTMDGMTTATEVCDPVQGSSCSANTGLCEGPCSRAQLGESYVGCDYFPTVTANIVSEAFNFAVIVSNTTNVASTVTITRGANAVTTRTVGADSVEVITLPWVTALKGSGTSSSSQLLADGAYRLRSDQPVTVYQFSPLEYTISSSFSYTNDASLLLPTNVWGDDFWVIAYPHWSDFNYSALYAVTAVEDNTTVALTGPPSGTFRTGVAGINSSGDGMVTLNSGDVLQLFSASGDPTGSFVASDKPVQVIGGHTCTNVPLNIQYCDHLEESIYPANALSTTYVLTAPLIPSNTTKIRTVRIVATQPNTTLTYDPLPTNAPTSIASAGGMVEIQTTTDFSVTSNEPILVAEYMHGQNAGGGTGDPAFTLGIATEQFRSEYLFHAPTNYEANFVNIVAPTGATVQLDGTAVSNWQTIGNSGFQVARVRLNDSGNGNHSIVSNQGVGVTVYGYGQYTSYWYPGGSNVISLN